MRLYRVSLLQRSPLATRLMGDTLFGHLCWGIALNEGEEALNTFLHRYDGGKPPLLLSDAFPSGWLPRPMLAPTAPDSDDGKRGESCEEHDDRKRRSKRTYIPRCWLWGDGAEQAGSKEEKHPKIDHRRQFHNSIDRVTGWVGEDAGLYSQEIYWVEPACRQSKEARYDLYVATTMEQTEWLKLLRQGIEFGYGADSSTGHGEIEICNDAEEVLDAHHSPTGQGRYVALGSFVPDRSPDRSVELDDLRADLFTKFGKVGGWLGLTQSPFKRPIVMYRAGATFRGRQERRFVGCLLRNIHADGRIRHHAFAPVLPFNPDRLSERLQRQERERP